MRISPESLISLNQVVDTTGRHFSPLADKPLFEMNRIKGREGHKTNVEAFKEFSEHDSSVFKLVCFLRSGYSEPVLPIGKLHDLASAIYVLPVYLVSRRSSPIGEDAIPPSLIDASRASVGISYLAGEIMLHLGREEYISGEKIYEYGNGNNPQKRNFFVQPHGTTSESCPAPEKTVKKVLNMMIGKSTSDDDRETDWAGLITEDEVGKILVFGTSYTSHISIMYHLRNLSADKVSERYMAEMKQAKLNREINIALGFTNN